MNNGERLASFVGSALEAGQSEDAIRATLRDAGWTEAEIAAAMDLYAGTASGLAVPRPRPVVTAGEALIYGLVLVLLTAIVWHLASLGFQLIDRWMPEPFETNRAWRTEGMRFSSAVLLVAAPVLVFLDMKALAPYRNRDARRRSALRSWFGNITMFAAILTVLGALVAAIFGLLDGETAARFYLKCLVVIILAVLVGIYGRRDAGEGDRAA